MATLELLPAVFSILSGLVDERAGLHYDLLDRELLQEKASARALEVGFDSLLDYYYFLKYDAGGEKELAELIDTLVVNETYFFREWTSIQTLVNSFIEPWCEAGRRPRIWSAACASGEEPLSLAMVLDDRNLLDKVDIVATDISTRVLNKARSGQFSRRSVRSVPEPRLLEKYIKTGTDEKHSVPSRLVDAIRWDKRNLLNDAEIDQLGAFDVILCRNVLIYFSDKTVRSVLDRLSRVLVQDGVLVVGVSESLLRYGSSFTGEERGGAFVYRKTVNK
jgi:chemotaxis protein methyltransferase CheR